MELIDQVNRVAHIRTIVKDCSDLTTSLESALDSAEQVCPADALREYASRIGALASRP